MLAWPAFHGAVVRRKHRVKVLISRHRDGEINAYAAQRLGVIPLRGSGDHGGRFDLKGGVGAYQVHARTRSREGYNMALTADVPKVARVAGIGIVDVGRDFGTSDLSCRNCHQQAHRARQLGPFGGQPAVQPNCHRRGRTAHGAGGCRQSCHGGCRATLQQRLQEATRRAYAIVDRKDRRCRWRLNACR